MTDKKTTGISAGPLLAIAAGLAIGAMLMAFVVPIYRVWSAEKLGMAELARAEQNRQVRIEEARAEQQAAALLAEAEVLRARGVREANEIIADGLGGPDGYLRYLFIQALQENPGQVIYVPTEAALPILEATRLGD